mmetsp:Transcript_16531/g.45322  ORF Transcript_16531/g.45322 Transcript_16531/m.45322 type:complete len:240 (-) Transcript_16531:1549-2268(-)
MLSLTAAASSGPAEGALLRSTGPDPGGVGESLLPSTIVGSPVFWACWTATRVGEIERLVELEEMEADRSPSPMTVRRRSERSRGGHGCIDLGTVITYLYCRHWPANSSARARRRGALQSCAALMASVSAVSSGGIIAPMPDGPQAPSMASMNSTTTDSSSREPVAIRGYLGRTLLRSSAAWASLARACMSLSPASASRTLASSRDTGSDVECSRSRGAATVTNLAAMSSACCSTLSIFL